LQKIQALESTIEGLETSQEQLSRSLEGEKRKTLEIVREMERKLDALTRDQEFKSAEIDSLRKRLSKYSDYDELRRELEIMKVCET
jgi:homeobox protein cut-like